MERIVLQLTCDFCTKRESVDAEHPNQAFLPWSKFIEDGKTVNFCSRKCERDYLEQRLHTCLYWG